MVHVHTYNDLLLVSPHTGLFRTNFTILCGGLYSQTAVTQFTIDFEGSERCPHPERLDHNTGDYVPYSYRTVSGFFNVPYYLISNKDYETGPPVSRGGGGVLPYLGYTGTCRWIGYGFLASLS